MSNKGSSSEEPVGEVSPLLHRRRKSQRRPRQQAKARRSISKSLTNLRKSNTSTTKTSVPTSVKIGRGEIIFQPVTKDEDLPGYKESLEFWSSLKPLHGEDCSCSRCVRRPSK